MMSMQVVVQRPHPSSSLNMSMQVVCYALTHHHHQSVFRKELLWQPLGSCTWLKQAGCHALTSARCHDLSQAIRPCLVK